MDENNKKGSLYINGSKLNQAFIDKIKNYENIDDISSLGTALADLEESFDKILGKIHSKIEFTASNDYDGLLEAFMDLWMELKHIKYHVEEAEPNLLKLTNYLSEKSED